MSRRRFSLLLLLFGLVCGTVADTAHGQLELTPASGVLVLRNGSVLQGQVTRLGDRYLVTLPSGSELRLSEADVEMVARTLPEAYQRRLANLSRPDVPSFLDLAEWCLRHQLTVQAADALTRAAQLEPDNPRLERLQRRLEQLVSAPPPQAATATPTASPASLEQLEQLAREMPYGTLERFSSGIQPMLLNRCGANNCHGPASSSSYHLVRPPLGQTATRRFTLRNLHATLQTIRAEAPDDSPLLNAAREPHGSLRSAVFTPHEQTQYEQLAAWVRQISQPRRDPQPASIAGVDGRLHQATPVSRASSPAANTPNNSNISTNPSAAEAPGSAAATSDGATQPAGANSATPTAGSPPATTTPSLPAVDPFDPEVFNRRYFGNGKTPAPKR